MHQPVPPQATPDPTTPHRRSAGRHRVPPVERTVGRGRAVAFIAAVAALVIGPVVGLLYSSAATAAPTTYTIWPSSTTPKVAADPDTRASEVGVKFSTSQSGWITAIRYFKSASNTGRHIGHLWDSSGRQLSSVSFSGETASGWQQASLTTPVQVRAGGTYTASYYAPAGHYAGDVNALSPTRPTTTYALNAVQGVYSYSGGMPRSTWQSSNYYVDVVFTTVRPAGAAPTTTGTPSSTTSASPTSTTATTSPTSTASSTTKPAPTTTSPAPSTTTAAPTTTAPSKPAPTTTAPTTTAPAPSTAWPDASNTGVPTGTALSTYSGPCTITTAGTVIDAKTINCDVVIRATGVKISRSHINGRIVSTSGGSVAISDTYIDGGQQETFPAVGQENISLLRVNVVGGQHSVQCYANCTLQDSYLHAQMQPADVGHVNAFISNGGSGFHLKHNTLHCTVVPTGKGGGCTADASLFGDFGPVSDATFENNLFKSNSTGAGFCTQAGYNPGKSYPVATNVSYVGNVFERGSNGKCGIYGPVTAFNASASGNVWSGNAYTDGTPIQP